MELKSNTLNLIDYKNIDNSPLFKSVREFYNFPDGLHKLNISADNEHYVTIEFYNYQKTHCSVTFQKKFNFITLKKGSGGVNFDYIKLINNLIKFKIFQSV